jgi:hypothetical protein
MPRAANRTTTRKEDKAYCLFGISDRFMPLLYGEGEEDLFVRLEETVGKGLSMLLFSLAMPFSRRDGGQS